jgi:hypothetical protein
MPDADTVSDLGVEFHRQHARMLAAHEAYATAKARADLTRMTLGEATLFANLNQEEHDQAVAEEADLFAVWRRISEERSAAYTAWRVAVATT